LDKEGGEHEGEGSAVDDEAESPNHEPGENAAYDPVLPARRQPLQHRVQPFRRLVLQSQNFYTYKEHKIDSMEPIPPGCVAWRSSTTTLFLLGY
jgi:hypothetical protein